MVKIVAACLQLGIQSWWLEELGIYLELNGYVTNIGGFGLLLFNLFGNS